MAKHRRNNQDRDGNGGGGGGGGNNQEGGHGRGGNQPFQPLAPGFSTNRQFRRAVRSRTRQALHDQIAPINQQMEREEDATEGRQKDLGQYYRYYGNELGDATKQLGTALTNLIAANSGATGDSQAALRGALDTQRSADLAQATKVGGVAADPSESLNALATANASGAQASGQLGQVFGGMVAQSAGRRGIAALDRVRAQEQEEERYRAIVEDLARQRLGIKQTKPALREEARSSILQEERDSAAQRLQARLAREQLHSQERQANKDRKQQQQQFNAQLQLDQQRLDQEQEQFEAQLEADVAAGNTSQADADAGIGKFRTARTQVENWLEKQTSGKHKKITDQEISQLFKMLKGNYNIPPDIIMRVFDGSGIRKLKNWKKGDTGRIHPNGTPGGETGSGGHPGPT